MKWKFVLLASMASICIGIVGVAQDTDAGNSRRTLTVEITEVRDIGGPGLIRKPDNDALHPVAPDAGALSASLAEIGTWIRESRRPQNRGSGLIRFAQNTHKVADAVTDCAADQNEYNSDDFRHVLENFERTTTLRLEGAYWNDTLVRNCRIHNTGGDGIYIKNVRGVVIHNCEISNVGIGIKTSSTGRTKNVIIDGNYIHDVQRNGINAGQRTSKGVDQENLQILNNKIENTGLTPRDGHTHGIYVQARDFRIDGNSVSGRRDGNGISVRSSGVVRCNRVSGVSFVGKPGIRYYSDHQTGPSDTLLIEHNEISSETIGIQLYKPVNRYDGKPPPTHVVKRFIIRHNKIMAPDPVRISGEYNSPPYSVLVSDNK